MGKYAPMSTGMPGSQTGSDLGSSVEMEPGGGMAPATKERSISLESQVISDSNGIQEVSSDKKVIKNGNLNLRVERVEKAVAGIEDAAKNNGGEVFSKNIYQSGTNFKRGTVTVKVPVANFERAMDEIKKTATLVVSETSSGQDVTEEYQDLETQIRNKKSEEEAYLRIFSQAQKISDILEVQQQLSGVRMQIEQLEGQRKYMESQTDMSTITVSLAEDPSVTVLDQWRPLQVAKDAMNTLVKKIQGFVDFLIKLLVVFLPVMILYGFLAAIFYWIGRKIYLRFRNNSGKKEN